ncbi:hypothetical protein [Thermoleptolyngbya sp.]
MPSFSPFQKTVLKQNYKFAIATMAIAIHRHSQFEPANRFKIPIRQPNTAT